MAVAKITEIQASSKKGFDDAVKAGISRADKTLRNLTGAWVKSQKVKIEKGKIVEYRVLLKVTFVLNDKEKKSDVRKRRASAAQGGRFLSHAA